LIKLSVSVFVLPRSFLLLTGSDSDTLLGRLWE
jgi:hypothetical protein